MSTYKPFNKDTANSIKEINIFRDRIKNWWSCNGPEPVPAPAPPSPGDDKEVIDWGVKRVGSVAAFEEGIDAGGFKVCVLDTGVDINHKDLIVKCGRNFTSSNVNDYMDRQGHGTHTFGLIAAIWDNELGVVGASQASVCAGKVLSDDGYGYNDWIANGMIWAVQNGRSEEHT